MAFANEAVGLEETSPERKNQCHCQVGSRVVEHSRSQRDGDSPSRASLDVDEVVPDAVVGDEREIRKMFEHPRVNPVSGDDQRPYSRPRICQSFVQRRVENLCIN